VEGEADRAPRLLYALQRADLSCKVACAPNQVPDGKVWERGSIIIPVVNQEMDAESLLSELQSLAGECQVPVYALKTGFMPQSIDLGSPQVVAVEMPTVAVVVGDGVRSYGAGEVWHLLDTRYQMPVSQIPLQSLSSADLYRYDVLIMPDGSYGRLTQDVHEQLSDWISRGGRLICWQRSASWTASAGLTNWKFSRGGAKDVAAYPFAQRIMLRGAQVIGGAIFSARIDATHPLGFGYPDGNISLFRNNNRFMLPEAAGTRFPMQYTASPLLSGYISDDNLALLKESAGAAVTSMGKGKIIGLSDNPAFRAFWFGTNKLLANAIFFGDLM